MARVLIVEDEQADRIILASIVEEARHEVYFASQGKHALEIYKKISIDVVITDLQMPVSDGLELVAALRGVTPDVAIIAVSGKGPDLLAAAMREGVLAAFSKPVDPREFLEALERAVLPVADRKALSIQEARGFHAPGLIHPKPSGS